MFFLFFLLGSICYLLFATPVFESVVTLVTGVILCQGYIQLGCIAFSLPLVRTSDNEAGLRVSQGWLDAASSVQHGTVEFAAERRDFYLGSPAAARVVDLLCAL